MTQQGERKAKENLLYFGFPGRNLNSAKPIDAARREEERGQRPCLYSATEYVRISSALGKISAAKNFFSAAKIFPTAAKVAAA